MICKEYGFPALYLNIFNMPIAINNLRVGHTYYIRNFGEEKYFVLESITPDDRYIVKDMETLEIFDLEEITRFGLGKDYELLECEENDFLPKKM